MDSKKVKRKKPKTRRKKTQNLVRLAKGLRQDHGTGSARRGCWRSRERHNSEAWNEAKIKRQKFRHSPALE